jgi:hypothetical protein
MKKILVVGHSHIHALKRAKTVDELFEFYLIPEKGIDSLHNIDGKNYLSVVLLVGGNCHNIFGLVQLPEPFDFYLPEEINLPLNNDARLLPVSLVTKVFERNLAREFRIALKISQIFKGNKIYQIESPPPQPQENILKYPGIFKEKITELGVSSGIFRYKLWRLQSNMAQKYYESIGISFIAALKESQNPRGLLKKKYWQNDCSHANAFYGDLVLNQIRTLHKMNVKDISL